MVAHLGPGEARDGDDAGRGRRRCGPAGTSASWAPAAPAGPATTRTTARASATASTARRRRARRVTTGSARTASGECKGQRGRTPGSRLAPERRRTRSTAGHDRPGDGRRGAGRPAAAASPRRRRGQRPGGWPPGATTMSIVSGTATEESLATSPTVPSTASPITAASVGRSRSGRVARGPSAARGDEHRVQPGEDHHRPDRDPAGQLGPAQAGLPAPARGSSRSVSQRPSSTCSARRARWVCTSSGRRRVDRGRTRTGPLRWPPRAPTTSRDPDPPPEQHQRRHPEGRAPSTARRPRRHRAWAGPRRTTTAAIRPIADADAREAPCGRRAARPARSSPTRTGRRPGCPVP